MTDIEKKALALVGGILPEDAYRAPDHFIDKRILWNALCRAIEQHETDIADLQAEYDEVCKLFEAFKREVSDAVERCIDDCGHDGLRKAHIHSRLSRFIIAKPDPLVEVLAECDGVTNPGPGYIDDARVLRAAIEARGGRIVWEGE